MNRFYISLFFLFMAMTSSAQEQISGIIVAIIVNLLNLRQYYNYLPILQP